MSTAVADGNVDGHPVNLGGQFNGFFELFHDVRGEQAHIAYQLESPLFLVREGGDRRADNSEKFTEFLAIAREVLGGEHPQGDDVDAHLVCPAQELDDFPRSGAVSL